MLELLAGLRTVKELLALGGETAIVLAAYEELQKYKANFEARGYTLAQKRLSKTARVLLGLCFSEFLAEDDTDNELVRAAEKRVIFLKALGLDEDKLWNEQERLGA